ncbi:MAG: NPCBM/NEW2 domain-containing protein [Opitutaceae bacterium]|jgi:hypothetical protein
MKPIPSIVLIVGCLLLSSCATSTHGKRPDGLFLGDLHPSKANVGWGDYLVNFYPEHKIAKVLVDGRHCDYFIFAHPNSSAIYKIPEGMKTFTSTGIRPTGNPWISGTFTFEVLVDGKSLFKSESLNSYPGYQVPISVTLPAGAEVLQLRTDNLGNGFADHAIWAYPFFHKATNLPY